MNAGPKAAEKSPVCRLPDITGTFPPDGFYAKNERLAKLFELFNAVISSGLESLRAIVLKFKVNKGLHGHVCSNHYKVVRIPGAEYTFAFISF